MTVTNTENSALEGTQFTPFNDTDKPRIEQAIIAVENATSGIDTSGIDVYREGVNIRTNKHRFDSSQPKLWAGNINHFVTVRTIGQARSFTEFENSPIFEELPRFNPVQFIQDPNYPFPIVFNNGPQQEEEAIIEPFTIKFRKPDIDDDETPRSLKAILEDGNTFDDPRNGANRIEQFISFTPPSEARFFLDEGQEYFGGVFKPNFLDATFDPVALYQLTSLEFVDETSNNSSLSNFNDNLVILDRPSPFPNTIANPPVAFFDGTAFLTSSQTFAAAQLTGSMTAEIFFFYTGASPGSGKLFGHGADEPSTTPADNLLFSLTFEPGFPTEIRYFHEHGNGVDDFTTFATGNSFISGAWNHVAFTRTVETGSADITVYLNGDNLGTTALAAPSDGENAKVVVGNRTPGILSATWVGGLASYKIINRVLSEEEIKQEANRLLGALPFNEGSVNIEGFTPIIQREISPYNEIKDERIVDRIQTSDTDFIGALKALKFDLDGDIREDFDKKSSTAGYDVLGPNAGFTGTDSITYVGRILGS